MEWVTTIASVIAAMSALFATIFAGLTLNKSKKDQKEGLDRQKKQATLDAYNALQKQVFDHINSYKPSDIREIAENPNSIDYKTISGYLAKIEHFCVGINQNIYDIDTFYELAHGYFDSPKGLLMPRILPMLERKLDGAKIDYYANIHKVWKMMKEMQE